MKKWLIVLATLCLLCCAASAETQIVLSENEVSLYAGEEYMVYVVSVAADDTFPLTWETDDPNIAYVTSGGEIVGVTEGTTTLRVSLGDAETTCDITVMRLPTEISFAETEVELPLLDSMRLVPTITPEDRANEALLWESEYPYIATVDAKGNVVPHSKGYTTITCTVASEEEAQCTCLVHVTDTTLKGIAVSTKTMTLGKGQTMQVEYTRVPAQAVDTISFRSGNENVVTVDETGKVTAVADGKAAVYAYTDSVQTAIVVTVVKAPTKITLTTSKCTIGVGEKKTLEYVFEDGEMGALTWSSNGQSVTVDAGGTIEGLRVAKNTITCKTHNGKTAQCKVTVVEAPKSATFEDDTIHLKVGETVETKIITEKNAGGTITYSSTNETVATVSEDGTLTALSEGGCIITATYYNGVSAEMTVQVAK